MGRRRWEPGVGAVSPAGAVAAGGPAGAGAMGAARSSPAPAVGNPPEARSFHGRSTPVGPSLLVLSPQSERLPRTTPGGPRRWNERLLVSGVRSSPAGGRVLPGEGRPLCLCLLRARPVLRRPAPSDRAGAEAPSLDGSCAAVSLRAVPGARDAALPSWGACRWPLRAAALPGPLMPGPSRGPVRAIGASA